MCCSKKRYVLVVVVLFLLAAQVCALAQSPGQGNLTIAQVYQKDDVVTLYMVLSDQKHDVIEDAMEIRNTEVILGNSAPMKPSRVTWFGGTEAPVAYTIIIAVDTNELNAEAAAKLFSDPLRLFQNCVTKDDLIQIIIAGREVTPRTKGFDGKSSAISSLMADLGNPEYFSKYGASAGQRPPVIDALYYAFNSYRTEPADFPQRRAIMLITSGNIAQGKYSLEETQKLAANVSVPMYLMGIAPENKEKPGAENNFNDLAKLARLSGGEAFEGEVFPLKSAIRIFNHYIRYAYVVEVTPPYELFGSERSNWEVAFVDNDGWRAESLPYNKALRAIPRPTPVITNSPEPTVSVQAPAEEENTPEPPIASTPASQTQEEKANAFTGFLLSPVGIIVLVVLLAGIGLMVYFFVFRKKGTQQEAEKKSKPGPIKPEPLKTYDSLADEETKYEFGRHGDLDGTGTLPLAFGRHSGRNIKLIELRDGRSNDRNILVGATPIYIGRGMDSALRIEDPYVSRKHCILALKNNGVYLSDNKSKSGTLLNGSRLTVEAQLKVNDTIEIGNTTLKVSSL